MRKSSPKSFRLAYAQAAGLVIIAVMVFSASTWYESAEEEAVRDAAGLYIEGAKTGQAKYFEKAFAVGSADMKYVRKHPETGVETIRTVPVKDAIKNWTTEDPQESWGRVVDVRIIDEKLAHATIELLWDGYLYVDVMSMYKINGEWKIVNKTFVSRGKAEE